jgi:hemerythrin superfamily protein
MNQLYYTLGSYIIKSMEPFLVNQTSEVMLSLYGYLQELAAKLQKKEGLIEFYRTVQSNDTQTSELSSTRIPEKYAS